MNAGTDSTTDRPLIRAYLAAEAVLFAAVKAAEFASAGVALNVLRDAAIALNALVAAYCCLKYGKEMTGRDRLIPAGLFLTALADVFLTLLPTDRFYPEGLACFCVVEAVYAAYLGAGRGTVLLRAALFASAAAALGAAGELGLSSVLGALNMAIISGNVISAWIPENRNAPLLFKAGITLFFGCDVSLMMRILTAGAVSGVFGALVWTFYIPGQVLITLSCAGPLSGSQRVPPR